MSLTPYSRDLMRSFKAEKDLEIKNLKIESIVKQVYERAVRFAETDTSTIYKYTLRDENDRHHGYIAPNDRHHGYITVHFKGSIQQNGSPIENVQVKKDDIVKNMEEILSRLRILFPDCSVDYKKVSMATGRDGKEYDISVLDDKLRQFIDLNRAIITENIVIDWS